MYKYYIKVLRVLDGDTVDVMVDLGFNIFVKKRIRLHGIDAPEVRTRDSVEKAKGFIAKKRLEELFSKHDNKAELVSHGIGKYGRCLGVLFIKSERDSVNDILIHENLVKKWED